MAAGIIGLTFILIFGIIGILVLALCVLRIVGEWKVFVKAGKPGWAALIPFYNVWVLYEISGVNPLFSLFLVGGNLLSLLGNVLNIIANSGNDYNAGVGIFSILVNLSSSALSIASIVFTVIACINLAKCFKKEGVYGLGLAFLAPIFFPMLGFDKNSEYSPIKK